MVDFKKLQREVYENKINKNFNVTDIAMEFCLIHEEVSEAYKAWRRKLPDLGEEIADVVIYLLGLSEILGINLEDEVLKKIKKNGKRRYQRIKGVLKRAKDA